MWHRSCESADANKKLRRLSPTDIYASKFKNRFCINISNFSRALSLCCDYWCGFVRQTSRPSKVGSLWPCVRTLTCCCSRKMRTDSETQSRNRKCDEQRRYWHVTCNQKRVLACFNEMRASQIETTENRRIYDTFSAVSWFCLSLLLFFDSIS